MVSWGRWPIHGFETGEFIVTAWKNSVHQSVFDSRRNRCQAAQKCNRLGWHTGSIARVMSKFVATFLEYCIWSSTIVQ